MTLALCLLAAADKAPTRQPIVLNSRSTLKWADTNAPGVAAFFVIRVYSQGRVIHSHSIDNPAIAAKTLLGKMIPGEYTLRIQAVDRHGMESQPSPQLAIIWIGQGTG